MNECPTCEYHKQRAQLWRDEVYRLAGHPLPRKEKSMTQDEIIELAKSINEDWWLDDIDLQTFAKLVAEKERDACWQIACDYTQKFNSHTCLAVADAIRARGQA